MTDLLRPQDLKKIATDKEMAKANEALGRMQKEKEEADALHEAFISREIHPDVKQRVNSVIARAAENGVNEVLVVKFPASYCNDGGAQFGRKHPLLRRCGSRAERLRRRQHRRRPVRRLPGYRLGFPHRGQRYHGRAHPGRRAVAAAAEGLTPRVGTELPLAGLQ